MQKEDQYIQQKTGYTYHEVYRIDADMIVLSTIYPEIAKSYIREQENRYLYKIIKRHEKFEGANTTE